MGHGPDLKAKIGDSTTNIAALNDTIKKKKIIWIILFKKGLISLTNIYIFAQVNENKAITEAEERQHILDNIKLATEILSDKTVEAITNPKLGDVIENARKAIDHLKQQYADTGGKNWFLINNGDLKFITNSYYE